MPSYYCKITKDNQDIYFVWSTIVDAPITYGMDYPEFKDYVEKTYGTVDENIWSRLDTVGTSSLNHNSIEDFISCNRAGPQESCLSLDELIAQLLNKEADNTDWKQTALDKITKIAVQLDGEHEAPSYMVVNVSYGFVYLLYDLGIKPYKILPLGDGGISFRFKKKNHTRLEISNSYNSIMDFELLLVLDKNGKKEYKEVSYLKEATDILLKSDIL